jgi:hypothetical protein
LVVACGGSSVDLGQRDAAGFFDLEGPPVASADGTPTPQTIYEAETRVIAFTVDETKLWALIDSADDNGALVSCPIDRCRSERQTLARGVGSFGSMSSSTSLVLASDMLFWIYGEGFPGEGVARCRVSGCEAPTLAESPQLETNIAGDADHVYWVDADGWLTRWGIDDAPAERLRDLNGSPEVDGPLIGRVNRITIAGDYAYFRQVGATQASVLSRVRKDGAAAPEVLLTADHVSSVGATLTEVYYTFQTLAGSVRARAVTGNGGERVLASNQRWPLALEIAGSEAFWINKQQPVTNSPRGTLVSCALPECASTKTLISEIALQDTGLGLNQFDLSQRMALNSRWLIWIERGGTWGSTLRRLPR